MTFPLGATYIDNMDVADPNPYTPDRFAVIGTVEHTLVGNTVIRAGLTLSSIDHRWEQTLHLVLTLAEREALIAALVQQRQSPGENNEGVPRLPETAPSACVGDAG